MCQIQDNPTMKLSSQHSMNQQNTQILNPRSRTQGRKDRHTKISTAQGVRDRRVRLSMNIAREFFNLQDMLGFDKASKTLGWLLVHSRSAIDELASSRTDHKDERKSSDNETSLGKNKRSKIRVFKGVRNSSEEVKRREEARKRARDRTRNKKNLIDHNNQIQNHQRVQQDLMMICQSEYKGADYCLKSGGSSLFNHNYEMISTKDNYNDQDYCKDQNSEFFNKLVSDSCNYGDQFPALNIINFSTEIHMINAGSWDTHSSNQILH
ncbi:unnamed protein product [Amaranthus hypochondriacus]